MKYCTKCGTQIHDDAVICTSCGCATGSHNTSGKAVSAEIHNAAQNAGLKATAKVLMIFNTIWYGKYILPLSWCIPMTMIYFNKVKNGEPISLAFKICCLIFVSPIAGVLMLCTKD